jgi:O-antigen/teichoic acid export membrane protein
LFGKPELAVESYTFWLILVAVWIRGNADTFYYVLYARGQDKPLWLGDTLYLLPVTAANLALVPWLGLSGVGYSAIIGASFLLLWLGGFALFKKPVIRGST